MGTFTYTPCCRYTSISSFLASFTRSGSRNAPETSSMKYPSSPISTSLISKLITSCSMSICTLFLSVRIPSTVNCILSASKIARHNLSGYILAALALPDIKGACLCPPAHLIERAARGEWQMYPVGFSHNAMPRLSLVFMP